MASISSNDPINLNNNDPDFGLGTGTFTSVPLSLTADITGTAKLEFDGEGDIAFVMNGAATGRAEINDLADSGIRVFGSARISYEHKRFGKTSLKLEGSDDFIDFPADPTCVGDGDGTIEGWFYTTKNNTWQCLVGYRTQANANGAHPAIFIRDNNHLDVYYNNGWRLQGSTDVTMNEWHHFALVKDGEDWELFLDGVSQATHNSNAGWPETGTVATIGIDGTGSRNSWEVQGFMDEIRASSVARYTANFTPPTERFEVDDDTTLLLHFDGDEGSTVFGNSVITRDVTVATSATRTATISGQVIDMSNWRHESSEEANGTGIGSMAHAFDGSTDPLWAIRSWGLGRPPSAANPGWLGAINPTGNTVTPTQFRIATYVDRDRPTDFDIQGWNGSAWVNILANQTMATTDDTYDVATTESYSGFRIFCRSTPGGWFTVTEFQVTGRQTVGRFTTRSGSDVTYLSPAGTLDFRGIPAGERLIIRNLDGTVNHTVVSTGLDITPPSYDVGEMLTWSVHGISVKNTYEQPITVREGVNEIQTNLASSFGYITPTATISTLTTADGTTTTIDSAGNFALNLATKTVTFLEDYDLFDVASAVILAFRDIPEIYNDININPFDLDDVRGVSVLADWTIGNDQFVLNSGFAEFDTNGDFSKVDYMFQTEGNIDIFPIQHRLTFDGTAQGWNNLHVGPQDTILTIEDSNGDIPNDIVSELMQKNPVNNFYYYREVVRENGGRFQRDYTNFNKSFTTTVDTDISEDIAYDSNIFSYDDNANINITDFLGTAHNFTKVFYLKNGTSNVQDALNQMSKAAAEDDTFLPVDTRESGKPWELSDGRIIMDEGWYVRFKNGLDFAGDFRSLFTFSSSAGTVEIQASATVTINLESTNDKEIHWVVVNTDTLEVMETIGGVEGYSGNFSTLQRGGNIVQAISFPYVADVNFAVYFTAAAEDNIEPGVVTGVLTNRGAVVTVTPADKQVIFPLRTQLTSSPLEGTKAWNSVIDLVTLDTSNPRAVDIMIPTQYDTNGDLVIQYAIDYLVHGYQKLIGDDVRLMRYGILAYNSHQLPTGKLDYKLVPGAYFQNNGAINVPADRPAEVPVIITGSKVLRAEIDKDSRRSQVYAIPQGNGLLSVTIRTTEGATSQQLTDIQQSISVTSDNVTRQKAVIDDTHNTVKWMRSAGKLFGLKPNPAGEYDSDSTY